MLHNFCETKWHSCCIVTEHNNDAANWCDEFMGRCEIIAVLYNATITLKYKW